MKTFLAILLALALAGPALADTTWTEYGRNGEGPSFGRVDDHGNVTIQRPGRVDQGHVDRETGTYYMHDHDGLHQGRVDWEGNNAREFDK